MDFDEVVTRRRMVRRYTAEPVSPAAVDKMLANAVRAPNAGFTQGWAFVRLDAPDDVARFWDATTPPRTDGQVSAWLNGMRTAPIIIVPLASKDAYVRRYAETDKGWAPTDEPRWNVPYWHIDAGMASLLILQTAVAEGLGACFFGIPSTQIGAFRAAFGVPDEFEPIGAITIGHADTQAAAGGSPKRRGRRPVQDVVHHGRWNR